MQPSLPNSRQQMLRLICGLISYLAIALLSISTAFGQDKNPQRGFQPGNAYALSDIEAINTTNGNLILNFPLGRVAPGRGGLSVGLNLRYNSKLYDSDIAELGDITGQTSLQTHIIPSEQGGWIYSYNSEYRLEFISRNDVEGGPYQCTAPGTANNKVAYIWKVKVIYPDGGAHEFRPNGYSDVLSDGYFNVSPYNGEISSATYNNWGSPGCTFQILGYAPNPMTYYSTDGTYTRLVINRGSGWTLSFPDGSRAVNDIGGSGNSGANKLFDRNNNNAINTTVVTLPNGHSVTAMSDEFGRYIAVEHNEETREDYIYSLGFNNQSLMWTVKWKSIFVVKPYKTTPVVGGKGRGNPSNQVYQGEAYVVESITLPSQLGSLRYQFSYNAYDYLPKSDPPSSPSTGWGEVSGITLPSGAQANYQYARDGSGGVSPTTRTVLDNSVTQKTLSYQAEYDGASTNVSEGWSYFVSPLHKSSTITGPDGGVTTHYFNDTSLPVPASGLVYKEVYPDGEVLERLWQTNSPSTGTGFSGAGFGNFFVKTEFHSITDAGGNLVKTAIKDFDYDKNGNVTRVAEYDWVDYNAVPRNSGSPSGIPAGAILKRVSNSTFWHPTPNASDNTSNTADCYWNPSAPTLRTAGFSTETGDGTVTLARTESTFDDAGTTGNLTQQMTWDSSKGPLNSSSPILTSANSISTSQQYTSWAGGTSGKLVLKTDARGTQTSITYGTVGGFELYPTQVRIGFGSSVQRTANSEYDLSTGAITRITDADNNVATSTNYDAIGRPILVRAAEGRPEEKRITLEYADVLRRVIARSDLNTAGDGKLVTIQHYDQLGRVRLTRQLEDAATQSETDETAGIKVQTRYLFSGPNSYQLVSNPYRATTSGASTELTMGWTRSKSDVGGRLIEVQTFGGAALPAPWGGSSVSTGTETIAYDANFTTTTDQAGKVRRNNVDGLGRLVRVDEPNDSGALGTTDIPTQPTSYTYDALSNLKQVNQASQVRTFVYSSVGRLTAALNPESGTINYQYDNNGNLLVKSDARNVSAHASYDELNRPIRRWFNGSSSLTATTNNNPALPAAATEEVKYSYDSQSLPAGAPANFVRGSSAGRLVAVTYGGGSAGDYFSYDVLGRSVLKIQQTGGVNYQTSAIYNSVGAPISETYPSGRMVSYSYDGAGRANSVTGTLGDGASRSYSSGITYSALGALRTERFGTDTPIYNKLYYNSRGQLGEIRESTILTSTDWNRGAIINFYSTQGACWGASCNASDNNGNLMRQEHWIPDNEQVSSYQTYTQSYGYDYLNRLKSVSESKYVNGSQTGTQTFNQAYIYDVLGNRTINTNPGQTWGGVNNLGFEVETATNRLYSPGDLALPDTSRRIRYDNAGNQTTDSYTGQGTRSYDADNRLAQAWANGQWQSYTYDGNGQRVRRTVNNLETWQVYGIDGELLAEYAANAAAANPQKEYGYRNEQLLITAAAASGQTNTTYQASTNFATTQGQQNWYYLDSTGAQMTYNTGGGYWEGPQSYLWLWANGGHPGPAADSVRQWRAPQSGSIHITGNVSDSNTSCGDGVVISIKKGAAVLWQQTIENGNTTGFSYDLTTTVITGDQINFVINRRVESNYCDGTNFDPTITLTSGSGGAAEVNWLVTDQLGTPRMIFDHTGSLANIKRHDYLPFGEEIFAGIGQRTAAQGYASDALRQKFTGKERDVETGLDYFNARYYSSLQGRFTSADSLLASASLDTPQSWNRHAYVLNNPLRLVDPSGLMAIDLNSKDSDEPKKLPAPVKKDDPDHGLNDQQEPDRDHENERPSMCLCQGPKGKKTQKPITTVIQDAIKEQAAIIIATLEDSVFRAEVRHAERLELLRANGGSDLSNMAQEFGTLAVKGVLCGICVLGKLSVSPVGNPSISIGASPPGYDRYVAKQEIDNERNAAVASARQTASDGLRRLGISQPVIRAFLDTSVAVGRARAAASHPDRR